MSNRNLLLVNPPQSGLLNGFANGLIDLANFVAARLPELGISIVDLALTPPDKLAHAVRSALGRSHAAPIVGITTTTASYYRCLQTARAFKAAAPETLIVFGGHHASPQHDVILRNHSDIVDVVVRGEGERALCALASGQIPEEVSGCTTHRRGELRVNPSPALLSRGELDALPVTFRGSSFLSAPGKFDHATYVSARGCPLRCAFCSVAGVPIRSKSVDRTIEDLRYLVDVCGYRKIAIEDNFFAQNKERVMNLCAGIATLQHELHRPFAWDCQTRVESMHSPEVRAAFARAHCEGVYLGIESLLEQELEYLGKTSRPSRFIELTFDICSKLIQEPYETYVNLQFAIPGETSAHRGLRLQRLARLGHLAAAHGRTITVFPQLSVIYPGTQHFWRAIEDGVFGCHGANVFEAFSEWEAHEQPILRFLGENFAHGVGGIPLGLLDADRLRRNGEFIIRQEEVHRLRTHLSELETIDGIQLFKYGSHLVYGPTRDSAPAKAKEYV